LHLQRVPNQGRYPLLKICMTSISEVLQRLEIILAWAKENQSPQGYFAALYYQMTKAVAGGIDANIFENGTRMERLDVNFAQRYLDAWDGWQSGRPISKAWKVAFEATENPNVPVLQHLILGVNAHINLDLGIAAAQTRPKDAIFGLKRDFELVNATIGNLVDDTQNRLAHIWLPFRWIDWLLRTEDEGMINFSIKMARGAAWQSATAIAFAPNLEAEHKLVEGLDAAVAGFGNKLLYPGYLISFGLWLMRKSEMGTVAEKIEFLLT